MNQHHPNSVAAYRKMRDDGTLSALRSRILGVLLTLPPATASEIAIRYQEVDPEDRSSSGRGAVGNVHARLKELCDRGVVRVAGSRKCTVTGRTVNEYAATGELPSSPPKRNDSKMTVREFEAALKASGYVLRQILRTKALGGLSGTWLLCRGAETFGFETLVEVSIWLRSNS